MIVTMGADACRTSFHTEIRYGAFVDRAGAEALSGAFKNYCSETLNRIRTV